MSSYDARDVTDLYIFNSGTRQQSSERLTTHKVSVLVLIYEYYELCGRQNKLYSVDLTCPLSDRQKGELMLLILDLVLGPDVDLKGLRAQIDHVIDPVILKVVYDRLHSIATNGVKSFSDNIELVTILLSTNNEDGMIRRESVLGVYIRRMELAYYEMSFSQVVEMCNKFKRYYEAGFPEAKEEEEKVACRKSSLVGFSETGLSMSLLDEHPVTEASSANFFSKKQAEYFLANQALMLSHDEGKALPPDQLQQRLSSILSDNPDLAEAHFLSYINSLRVKEYCTAMNSLYHYFDRKASMLVESGQNKKKGVQDEVAMRYAALNLASLQFRFGNKEPCRAALREAIRLAQESNDQICLQHALVWLNLLGENHTGVTQLERSIKKTIDLSLPKLAVLGLHWISKGLGTGTELPARVIDYFTQSNLINCMNSNYGMMCTGCVQRAAMWHYYGKRELCSLDNQIVLNLNTSLNGVYYNGQAVCIALCNLAQHHADVGEYAAAFEILGQARLRFPCHTSHSEIWQSCQQRINFTRSLNNRKFNEAEQSLIDLEALDEPEAKIRKPLLLKEKGHVTEAFSCLNLLLSECDKEKSGYYADYRCRVLLELAALYIATGNCSAAVIHITDCIAHAKKHYLELYEGLGTAYLAFVQLSMNLPNQGLQLIESQLTRILTNASALDKGKVLYIYAKCKVAASKLTGQESARKSDLLVALNLMNNISSLFQQVEAYMLEKDAWYFQAMLYNSLCDTENRNKCAYQFKLLDKLYPTLNTVGLTLL
ncbi:anaphase-promoting complex subunit 5-like isoform X1 [Biomphalaria glabrata]|uniref:Anaphase-promoting complex subunit 5 n=1 Tax=Biomphalaria glabrata TaxID=6526 RepID=A0A9W3BBC9_BIOGL|nr:anaphase-promoting complex subunit 5-like isoform X1 [Biomphalaria glabrata]XP_055896741.1 anaphase-promoting complex subunit 5-like isoform X1 [Biomphalaria glabrata]XP_055896742.1 anaphase-promoting complex subunit 5-like isoform X1 [Biomphalaria glabrata]